MVCLSRLTGAIVGRDDNPMIDYDQLVTTFRKCLYIIKRGNIEPSTNQIDVKTWVDRTEIKRTMGLGFPIYTMNIDSSSERRSSVNERVTGTDVTDASPQSNDVLRSSWFRDFSEAIMSRAYPIDRFTVLIALAIIGVRCQHLTLEQLIGELVDQMVHEEANSCMEDELMQLRQVGSFWLSYRRRFQVLFNCSSLEQTEDCFEIDGSESLSTASSSPGRVLSNHLSKETELELRSGLRSLINEELINGSTCPLCQFKPAELLQSLRFYSCPGCNKPPLYSSITFAPLQLFSLDSLLIRQPNLRSIIIISPNEWSHHLLKFNDPKTSRRSAEVVVSEVICLSESVQRLTVVREPRPGEDKSNLASDDDDGLWAEQFLDPELNLILRKSINMPTKMDAKRASISLRLLSAAAPSCISLALCSSDVLIMDSVSNKKTNSCSLKLLISLMNDNKSDLWTCSGRSPISGLMFGCGRLFTGLELVSSGQDETSGRACLICKCQLSRVYSLFDGL